MSDVQKVNISGGTFALCLWLFMIMCALSGIRSELRRINETIQQSIKIEVVEPNDPPQMDL